MLPEWGRASVPKKYLVKKKIKIIKKGVNTHSPTCYTADKTSA
jgi:hypothetical protein